MSLWAVSYLWILLKYFIVFHKIMLGFLPLAAFQVLEFSKKYKYNCSEQKVASSGSTALLIVFFTMHYSVCAKTNLGFSNQLPCAIISEQG